MTSTTPEEEELARKIVDCAYRVHRGLGLGLLESIYETCFCHELQKRGVPYRRQLTVPLVYDGIVLSDCLRLDVLVKDLIICELKSVDSLDPIFMAQILTQLKLARKRLGFLINFNVPAIKLGIRRVILSNL